MFLCLHAATGCVVRAQEYRVGSGASKDSQTQTDRANPSSPSLGWGSNIQNARLARAAQMALQRGDHALAFEYAQRAAKADPNDPQLWFLLGYAARLDGNYSQSADAYSRGLHLDPSALDGRSGLAQVYSVMGRTEEAERLLKNVISSSSGRRSDELLLGELYMKSKDYANAISMLDRAEKLRPDARAELLLALSYQKLGQSDLASRYLGMAERRSPGNAEIQRSMAGYYRDAGKYPEAIAALQSIRNRKPDVTAELAYTFQLDGERGNAAELYAQAANEEPGDLNLQLSAAQAEISADSIAKASPLLKRAEALDANDYRLHAIKAEIAEMQDRDRDAVREYTVALAHLPASPAEGALYGIQLHMNLVALDRSLGDQVDERHQLEIAQNEIRAVEISGPGRERYLRLRSLIKMNAGDASGALADIQQALAVDRLDLDNLQLDGDILMKLGRTEDAIVVYKGILARNPDNRSALTALGYASRAAGQDQEAENYFERLAKVDPSSHVAYLALGDLFTSRQEFAKAQASYEKGYELDPHNALIVAGGANLGIETHNLELAGQWMSRATEAMKAEPKVLREEERYLTLKGRYLESADVAQKAIAFLPRDRDVAVYLGYDLLHLGRDDQLLGLTSRYWNVLPKEPDIPLLAGYVHKNRGLSEQALGDFTEALHRDPTVVTAYVNRGYILNDLHQPQAAAADFNSALKRDPNDGEAHLGLAYANLDLHKPQTALLQASLAERSLGDSAALHVIRATAYGREGMLTKASHEYEAALGFTPRDASLHFGLGNAYFAEHRYRDSITELDVAKTLSPEDAKTYALLARSWANLQDRDQALRYIDLAERYSKPGPAHEAESPSESSDILVSVGEAFSTLGDQDAAMDHFKRALTVIGSDRVGVRLAIAQIMAQRGNPEDAERQIALAWMEAQARESAPPTGSQLLEAASLFSSMHNYDLSQDYLQRAKSAGAPDAEVRIGLANNDLAIGDTVKAKAELSAIGDPSDGSQSNQYLLAEANLFRQEHQNAQALTAFAQATNGADDDHTAEQGMIETGAAEGMRITPHLSLLSDLSVAPIFEDSTVYVLDSKLDASFAVPSSDTALLPPPRSSLQTQWTDGFHLHLGDLPAPGGFFQLRNARGLISVPSTNSIVDRDTTDSIFNFGLNPSLHLANNVMTFNGGIQETIRRDSKDPVDMNQNLFRLFAYMTTSSFFNAVSVSGFVVREGGPFTESSLRSRNVAGSLDFRVGAPWGKTALITGWGVSDFLIRTTHIEDHFTSSYVGIEHKFSDRVDLKLLAEDIRAWRIFGSRWAIAQNLRPAGSLDFIPKRNWDLQFTSAYSSTRGFHVYDTTNNSISVSYSRAFRRVFNDNSVPIALKYPIRFSAGMQQETFFNFGGGHNQQFRPYVQLTIF